MKPSPASRCRPLALSWSKSISRDCPRSPLWLKILDSIHRALPKREHDLLDHDETEEAIKAAYAKVPRAQRKEIFITSLESVFYQDVYLAAADAAGDPDAEVSTEEKPGFFITLEGWTPNQDGTIFLIHNHI